MDGYGQNQTYITLGDMKVKDIVYMVMDLLQNVSDDSTFTEDHVLFLFHVLAHGQTSLGIVAC